MKISKISISIFGYFCSAFFQPVAFGAGVNLHLGAPFSMISVSGRDGNDQFSSPAGLLLQCDLIADDSNIAATLLSKNSIGPENSLIASASGIGLSWSLGRPFSVIREDLSHGNIRFKPSSSNVLSVLVTDSNFDLTQAKPIPKEAVFVDDEPIIRGKYLGLELSFGHSILMDNNYLVSNLFLQQSLSSPGQNISVTWVGLSVSYQRNILRNF